MSTGPWGHGGNFKRFFTMLMNNRYFSSQRLIFSCDRVRDRSDLVPSNSR